MKKNQNPEMEQNILEALENFYPKYLDPAQFAEWESVKSRIPVGTQVSGVVLFRAAFGVWVDLGVGFPALLQIIQMPSLTPEAYQDGTWCPEGSPITAKIFVFSDSYRQIGLTQDP